LTSADLVLRLGERYPTKADNPMLDDISDVLSGLPPAAIDAAWMAYRNKWQGNRCPNSGWFARELQELGFSTKKAHRDRSDTFEGAWVCKECGTHYGPLGIYLCPSCGCVEVKGIGDCAHPSFRAMSEDSQWHKDAIEKLIERRRNGLSGVSTVKKD
jgi:hypothetical protein